jgi:membrane-bound metal-dependent hydrolase YbcI (DUF457 family)
MSSYFWDGFQHTVVGFIFAILFIKIIKQNILKNYLFVGGLIISSGSLFFLPLHIHPYNSLGNKLYQFLHYPISDWDILILGIDWHRFFISHSLFLPLFLLILFLHKTKVFHFLIGVCVGLSSHLIWDAITCSMITPVVFLSNLLEMRGYFAKGWLIINGTSLYLISIFISNNRLKIYKD